MKLINRDTDYAVKALIYIAAHNSNMIPVTELVENLDIPRPFLRKILQVLNRKGVLSSTKGKGGGFRLTLSPKKIFLMDLIRIFHGPVKLNECIFRKRICPDIRTCSLRKKIKTIEKNVIAELKSVTIASLLNENSSSPSKGVYRERLPKEKHMLNKQASPKSLK